MPRWIRAVLICFGLLDAMALGRWLSGIVEFFDSAPWWLNALLWVHAIFLLSLAVSAYGFVTTRKWALWLSYVQFPARAIKVTLSFGWITILATWTGWDTYASLVYAAIGLEVVRLVLTIVIHIRVRR